MILDNEVRSQIFPVLRGLNFEDTAYIPFRQHDDRVKKFFVGDDKHLIEKARDKNNINFFYCSNLREFLRLFPLVPEQQILYDFFIRGIPLEKARLLEIFPEEVLKRQGEKGIFLLKEAEVVSCVKIIAFLDDFLVTENFYEDKFDGVHLGKDSFVFLDFLRSSSNQISPGAKILDIGVGTGIVTKYLNSLANDYDFVGVDINKKALKFSEFNLYDIDHLELIKSDCYEKIDERFDVIVSNPPFVLDAQRNHLYDYGGRDGLMILKNLLISLRNHLEIQGLAFFISQDVKFRNENYGTLIRFLDEWNRENRCTILVEALENVFTLNPRKLKWYKRLKVEKISLCCIRIRNDFGNELIVKNSIGGDTLGSDLCELAEIVKEDL